MICNYSKVGSEFTLMILGRNTAVTNMLLHMIRSYKIGKLIYPKTTAGIFSFIYFQKFIKNNLPHQLINKFIENDIMFVHPINLDSIQIYDNYNQFDIFDDERNAYLLHIIKYQANILVYLVNEKYEPLSNIIRRTIEIHQKNAAVQFKYLKY